MSRATLMKQWRKQINSKTLFCYLCGELILRQADLSADHVIPKSKGGPTEDYNLRPAHKSCNCAKSDMSLEEFRRLMYSKEKGS